MLISQHQQFDNNMTIFVEKVLTQLNANSVEQFYCHERLPLVAAVSSQPSGQVLTFRNGKVLDDGPWNCPSKPIALTWHPTRADTIVGLKSGEIYCISWNEGKKTTKLPTTHESPVLFLLWPTETELISLDSMGVVSVWTWTKIGLYQLSVEHLLKDIPSQLVCTTQNPWQCFVGCTSGIIYQVTQGGSTSSEIVHLDDPIQKMTYFSSTLCALTNGATLSVLEKKEDSTGLDMINTVKMSGKSRSIQLAWFGHRLLAIAGGDLIIRLWNCETNETWILPIPQDAFHSGAEQFTSLAFRHQLLMAGTNLGNVCFWHQKQQMTVSAPDDDWQFIGLVGLSGGPIVQSGWSSTAICVHNGTTIYLIEQQQPCVIYKNQTGAVQLSSSAVSILKGRNAWPIDLSFVVLGMDLYDNHLLVRGDGQISVYQLSSGLNHEKPVIIGHFESNCSAARLHKICCFCLELTLIQMRTFQGSLLTTLSLMDSEGTPELLDVTGNFLCVASAAGYVKLWDVSSRDPKLHVSTRQITNPIKGPFLGFRQLKTNCDGSCLAFTLKAEGGIVNRLMVSRTNSNVVGEFDFDREFETERHTIDDFFWDEEEPRIVLCQLNGEKSASLVSLFVTEDLSQGILIQDQVDIGEDFSLVGVRIPKYTLLDASAKIHIRKLESLVPLEEHNDKATRDALLSFGCHLRRGRVEQAYQMVRSLTSKSIWENLARSCVRLQRPDVGLICLGKLGNARSAQAVRLAQRKYSETEAVTAVLAVQLAMNDEAEELCQRIGCYELLNKMYQASNQWEKALKLSLAQDRMNLKRTYYDYARHLENEGKTQAAREMYEKCQTHHFDVPRMLFEDAAALEEYCTSTNDSELLRWWAQFLESSGEMDAALETYNKAGDYLSLVRLHCYLGDLSRATELAEQSRNQAACFHVARQHEANNDIPEALKFFAQAGAYGNAVRLCKEHELDDQLYRYALQGDQEELIEAARYFECVPANNDRQPRFDRAVLLYSKAGLLDTALDLASRTDQHEAVLELSRRLDSNSNPASLQRCANYLASHRHYDAAVNLLTMAGKVSEAIEMCLQYSVKLTESLADQLTGANTSSHLLIQLAEAAQRQGDYQLAAKKFTQAGDKLQAMKALLKSGDTDRIVFFANVSRQREIYILAGNYLQTLDWRAHPEYVRSIVGYYTRAKSPELLAGFYEACAQAEIDEYQNYTSALNALKEALNTLNKSSENQPTLKRNLLLRKYEFLKQFIEKREMSNNNITEVSQLKDLLKSPDMEMDIIRPANIYSSVFDIQVKHKVFKDAIETLERMKISVPHFTSYLDKDAVLAACQAQKISSDQYLRTNIPDADIDQQEEIKEFIKVN